MVSLLWREEYRINKQIKLHLQKIAAEPGCPTHDLKRGKYDELNCETFAFDLWI